MNFNKTPLHPKTYCVEEREDVFPLIDSQWNALYNFTSESKRLGEIIRSELCFWTQLQHLSSDFYSKLHFYLAKLFWDPVH